MTQDPSVASSLHHHARRMEGRDPFETARVATPLELLFDLTFVTSFGIVASQFAHAVAEGHLVPGLIGFGFASFAICWAWVNFSWFASAFDTDDWVFRLVTMVQMIGVLVLAIGVPAMFRSLEQGERLDNTVMASGYVIMRGAMIFQWLRAARHDPARRRTCLTYASLLAIAQAGWVTLIFLRVPVGADAVLIGLLALAELCVPLLAERRTGGTPWHAHHIVERHSLIAIIALGEGVVGTVATLSAVVERQGWTLDAAMVGVAGTGLTFGMWWIYYMIPSARILHARRNLAYVWAAGQMLLVAAIVATGAGLHVAAYFLEQQAHISSLATVLCVAVPVAIYLGVVYGLYSYLMNSIDLFHIWLLLGTAVVVALAAGAAIAGLGMAACLLILMLAPAVTVVGYEMLGHRHQLETLARAAGD